MHGHETALCAKLLEGIEELPIRVIGKRTVENREANIAIISERHTAAELSRQLASVDIAAGFGDFYARRLIEKTAPEHSHDGVLRLSFAHYNTIDDVNRVVEHLRQLHGDG